jgi:hypothetical protein
MQTTMSLQEGRWARKPVILGRRPDCAAANLARIMPEKRGSGTKIDYG